MAFLRLLGPTNRWSASPTVLSALSAAAGLPAAASQNPDRSYVWRSLSQIANQTLTVDLGSSQAATAIALANIKLQNAGSVRLQEAGTGGAPGAWNTVATLPAQNTDRRFAYAFFGSVSARHWRLEWVNGSGVADTAEVGYVYLGTYVQPSRAPSVPLSIRDVEPSVGRASVDGQQTHVQRTPFQTGQFLMRGITEADYESLQTLRRVYGNRTPFFGVLDTSVTWQAWLKRFASDVEVARRSVAGTYDVSFLWEEAR